MAITRAALTDADIRTLVRGPTDDERAAAAHRLCRKIDASLSDEDRKAADEVLRLMAEDAVEAVRRALAVTLKNSPMLPRDVAMRLARDVDSIAAPILSFSPVFLDEDLVEIVRASSALKQVAVARRETLSEAVTGAIVHHGAEEAVRAAIANDNAAFSEPGLMEVVDRFAASEGVTTALAYRKVLPLSVCERLVDVVSDQIKEHLVNRHHLSPETAVYIALGAKERATLDLVEQAGRAADLGAFTAHLLKEQRLTPSLMLRALAHGQIGFLEWSIAALAGVPHHRAWLMVHDAGPLGFRAIYDKAALPPRLFAAFRAGVDAYHALQLEGGSLGVAKFQERMLQRFLTQPHAGGREDADYLLEKMDRITRSPPAERARAIA